MKECQQYGSSSACIKFKAAVAMTPSLSFIEMHEVHWILATPVLGLNYQPLALPSVLSEVSLVL